MAQLPRLGRLSIFAQWSIRSASLHSPCGCQIVSWFPRSSALLAARLRQHGDRDCQSTPRAGFQRESPVDVRPYDLPEATDSKVWTYIEFVVEEVIEDAHASVESTIRRRTALQDLERDPSIVDGNGKVYGLARAVLNDPRWRHWCEEYCSDTSELIAHYTTDDELRQARWRHGNDKLRLSTGRRGSLRLATRNP